MSPAAWISLPLLIAGILLVRRELRRKRPASRTAVAANALVATGTAWGAVAVAQGPLWPLAFVPALCSLLGAANTLLVLSWRRKAGRR